MHDIDFDRFAKSSASYAAASCNQKASSEKTGKRSWTFLTVGGVALLVLCAIVVVVRTDQRESSFDELVTTGGAVRRALPNAASSKIQQCSTPECNKVKKYIIKSLNTSVDPCQDFYAFACGNWIKHNPIPKTSSSFSTFSKLNQNVEKQLKRILEHSDSKITGDFMYPKAKQYYASCRDMTKINQLGSKPLVQLINDIGGWSIKGEGVKFDINSYDVMKTIRGIHATFTSSGGPLFSVHVSDDPKHSNKHIIEVDQAGPSLSRELYMNASEDNQKTLAGYRQYMEDVAKLLKCKDVKKLANLTLEFERELAKISVPDDVKQKSWFNKIKVKELMKEAPDYDWMSHINFVFNGHNKVVNKNTYIVVPAMSYLKKMMSIVKRTSKEVLSTYIVWSVIQDEVPYLSQKFLDTRKKYKERVLGTKGLRKRWKTCVAYTNEYLGEGLAGTYVNHHFPKTRKIYIEKMIGNIRKAFIANVQTLSWMDKKTKDRVQDKASAMIDRVGFPSYLRNQTRYKIKYGKLKLRPDAFFGNRMEIIRFAHNRMLNKINEVVDKAEWSMDPQTVNALYNFNINGMIIPAGILQPPFLHGDQGISVAMAYGAIGAILGHEMSHGFDNTGRQFDKFGEMNDWWTNKSKKNFEERTKCMVDQYNKYQVANGHHVNGKLTLGENIADNGGFKTSLRAYYDWLKTNQEKERVFQGLKFNNDQLFHIGFGQAYCSKSRPSEEYLATLNDRHTEERFRVIGTLSNSEEFAKAFNCKKGTRMNPKAPKCSVWVKEK